MTFSRVSLKWQASFFVFILCLFLFSFAAAQVSPVETAGNSLIITSKHKFPVQKDKAHAVKIVSNGNSNPSFCLSPSPDIKSKPRQPSTGRLVSSDSLRKKLSSRSAIIYDSVSGKTLYSYNADLPGQPASTIKILTGLISMRSLRDTEMVKASRRASGMPRSKIYLEEGTAYAADDLINAVLLASANDASVALAEKVAGSEKSFANLMTHKARSLGAKNTVCKTATGLTATGQQSTVRDLAVVFDKAMDDEEFARRIGKSKIKTSYGKLLRNHNKALWRVKGAVGGKTGYTRAARQTYVGKFTRGEAEIVVAIMGSETMWDDISRLVDYGFAGKLQVAALEKTVPVVIEGSAKKVVMAELSTALQNNSLQVLVGTQKQPKL